MSRYEINHEGKLVEGSAALGKIEKLRAQLFSQFGWTYEELSKEGSTYTKCRIRSLNGEEYILNLFTATVRDESRNDYEKKAQLGGKDPLDFPEHGNEKTIILGFYVYESDDDIKDAIIVAYPIDSSKHYKSNPSLRGAIFTNDILLKAKNEGFCVNKTHKTVAFRPEFIFYYLRNHTELHGETVDYHLDKTTVEDFTFPHNRITFGAPGTGKSHTLKKDSTVFENQNVVDDIEAKIKNQFSLCDSYGDFVRLGFVYTDDFNQKTVDKINSEFNTKKGYWIKKGTLLREELKNVPNYQEEEFSEQVTNFIQSIPNRKKETIGLALGYKYSNLFSDISIETLQEEYKAVPTVAYWIIYGIQAAQSDIEKEGAIKAKFSERVTFHPNYSYAQFVGTYKPVQGSSDEKQIAYQYVPGPFMRIYAAAKQNPNNNYLLLIEEINRANVAAVFGDVFQLLDRNADGESEYKVAASEDIKKYLAKKGIYEDELSIPSNMYIWATMNSADQGVFPMDTAFKRRWEFEYIGIDDNEDKVKDYEIPINSNQKVNWNELRKSINTRLIEMSINEDKLLGPFFLSKTVLENALVNPENFVKLFKSKVIMYLFEDAAKMKVKQLFKIDNNKYIFSEICKQFDEKGLDIFQIDTSNIKLSEVDNIKEDVIIPEGNTGTPSLFEQ